MPRTPASGFAEVGPTARSLRVVVDVRSATSSGTEALRQAYAVGGVREGQFAGVLSWPFQAPVGALNG